MKHFFKYLPVLLYVLFLLLFAARIHAVDTTNLNVPILMKHHQESHAVAGALVGLGVDAGLAHWTTLGRVPRLVVSVGTAFVIGTAKEYLWDRNPSNKEIAPWAWGAGTALAINYTVRW